MPRIRDTSPEFERFAKKAFLESPVVRQRLWQEEYRAAHPDVFEAFFASHGSERGISAVTRELSHVRKIASEAASALPELIENVEPAVRDQLGMAEGQPPLHVLMVGTFSANAFVVRLDSDVAVLHCLEWFSGPDVGQVLIAHEDTHAWHETALGDPPPADDLAWLALYEGLAVQTSKVVVPDRPEDDYFWYGVAGFEDWLPWCRENRDALRERFQEALDWEDQPQAVEAFFGSGFVEDHWRTGFFLADELVANAGHSLADLAKLSVDEGRALVRETFGK